MEAIESKIFSVGWQRRLRSNSADDAHRPLLENSLLLRADLFVLSMPSDDCMRLTHIMQGNLLTQSSLISMIISSKNTFQVDT